MHSDLLDVIETAKKTRDGVLSGELSVKEANAVAANNHHIVTSHGIDLRERIFLADSAKLGAAEEVRRIEGGDRERVAA